MMDAAAPTLAERTPLPSLHRSFLLRLPVGSDSLSMREKLLAASLQHAGLLSTRVAKRLDGRTYTISEITKSGRDALANGLPARPSP